jgi:hypothetical protein
MRRFWLFRSNLTSLEYYHDFKDLETFIKKCHDYYMLFPLWLLQADYFDEVTIWRLSNNNLDPIVFDINGKKYYQRWCKSFQNISFHEEPNTTFFRGGFKEYDEITKERPSVFGNKVYLGAGQRINAQWGGIYDLYLMEDDQDLIDHPGTKPFYKTASPFIFYPIKQKKETWDICWPCNFTQIKYKGQEEFIKLISENPRLKKLKIVHCGNKPEIGKQLCNKYQVDNIEFKGAVDRKNLNKVLNESKFGLNFSNRLDGCPRVSTEVLMAGTPLIIHERTRLLSYYKTKGVVELKRYNQASMILEAIDNHKKYKEECLDAIKNELSFDKINTKNISLW